MMSDIREELKKVLLKTGLSPESAATFIGCSGRQVRRWIKRISNPTLIYRRTIKKGIKKIKKEFMEIK